MKICLNLSKCNIHLERGRSHLYVEVSEGIGYKIDGEGNLFVDRIGSSNLPTDLSQYGYVKVKIPQESKPLELVADLDCCHLIQKVSFSTCTVGSKGNSILTTQSKNLVATIEDSLVGNFLIEGGDICILSKGGSTVEVEGDVTNASFQLRGGTDLFLNARVYGQIKLDLDKDSQFYRR